MRADEFAVFIALARTIERHDIPIEPFLDLISAFEQDQQVRRYETFEDLLDYCRRSANPVGRLVSTRAATATNSGSASRTYLHRAAAGELLAGCSP
jgi:phytoene/squalene synthetase